jgi:hypothetical protein
MRQVAVDLAALTQAMAEPEKKAEYFLDKNTGEILTVNRAKMRDVDIAGVRLRVSADQAGRYVTIPRIDSRVVARDMDDFARTVADPRVKKGLLRALVRQHRRTHDFFVVLGHYTPERIRWYAFKDARMRERVLSWLQGAGIELLERALD